MISENLNEIKKQISEYRNPDEVTIVAVTKYYSVEAANEAISLGITDIGENKVQQLCERNTLLLPAKRHLIGHLQTNKAKPAVQVADLIQSVDSERIASEIAAQAVKAGKIQDVLIELNIADEPTKTGASLVELKPILTLCSSLEGIRVLGLMAVMPINSEEKHFERMKDIFDDLTTRQIPNTEMRVLSMGMSGDYKIAIRYGSNMIRIGSALFK